jgi:Spy/CpxP family protein refolding chaperone
MKRWSLLAAGWLIVAAAPALSQQHQHGQSPYAGLGGREIKALSEDQIQQLRDGEGMGFGLPAELNHYPGPRHVLALADDLQLTPTQRDQIQALEEAMRSRARALGAAIIEKERALDQAFASGSIADDTLGELTRAVAELQGDLRYTHLSAHLGVKRVLTDAQVIKYDELRGYRQPPPGR